MEETSIEISCSRCRRRFELTPHNEAHCLGADPEPHCPPCADLVQQLRHLRSIAARVVDEVQAALPIPA